MDVGERVGVDVGVEINEGKILAVAFTKPYSWSVFVKMLVSTALLTASISVLLLQDVVDAT